MKWTFILKSEYEFYDSSREHCWDNPLQLFQLGSVRYMLLFEQGDALV